MSHIVVDMNNPTPPYEQVRREIIEQVRTGELTPGDKLPAIRVLAGDLGLAGRHRGPRLQASRGSTDHRHPARRRDDRRPRCTDGGAQARFHRPARGRRPDRRGLVSLFAGPVAAARARGARDVEILASVRAALAGESGERA